ncbi:MAG: phenylalanine--tRNA ligase alpha subunit [Chitinophagales bacterium]|nr:MAG: phenylalanine--tRNA ligase alpha subunit [Chitinophagales bacterium]
MEYASHPAFAEAQKLLDNIHQTQLNDAEKLEQFRIAVLGSKGQLKNLFARLREIPPAERKVFGQLLNTVKQEAEKKYQQAKATLEAARSSSQQHIPDLSMPGDPIETGARHPVSIVRKNIIQIFSRIGFTLADGPEIEDDWHNFSALNFPPDHPARDMQDTFFLSENQNWLLRTHTSTVQVRVMENQKPPIRVICPGRVYRNETISARAHCYFHQVEGLYVDKNVSFADLKQTLLYFSREFFGKDTRIRLRPSYFPFTEPSAELDVSCFICGGQGCAVCKNSGWVEILGCGMVDPQVLENCGINSDVYTGFAFGMGIERIAMLKYQIKDIRIFSDNDIRFLKQFAGAW